MVVVRKTAVAPSRLGYFLTLVHSECFACTDQGAYNNRVALIDLLSNVTAREDAQMILYCSVHVDGKL